MLDSAVVILWNCRPRYLGLKSREVRGSNPERPEVGGLNPGQGRNLCCDFWSICAPPPSQLSYDDLDHAVPCYLSCRSWNLLQRVTHRCSTSCWKRIFFTMVGLGAPLSWWFFEGALYKLTMNEWVHLNKHCRCENVTTMEWITHLPSNAEAEKMKSPSLHTYGCLEVLLETSSL